MNIERLDRLLTSKQLTDETGISRSTIYRLLQNGAFPEPIYIGPRGVRWLESDIKAWLVERKTLSLNVAGRDTASSSPAHLADPPSDVLP